MALRLLILLCFWASFPVRAQFKAEVAIAAVNNKIVADRMSRGLCKVIDEVNASFAAGRTPVNPDRSLIADSAFDKVRSFWSTSVFRITQVQLLLDGLSVGKGAYQLRGIPVRIDKDTAFQERELGFEFDRSGRMTDFFLCLELNSFTTFLSSSDKVQEYERRLQMSSFLENFRMAYNIKDLGTIEKVFSNDALIITGKIVRTYPVSKNKEKGMAWGMPVERVEYIKQKKEDYLKSLRKAFDRNEYLAVEFDEVEWVQNDAYPDVYGVTLRQRWKSSTYSDQGWLFLLIDYRNGDDPLIHVRTWQPLYLNGKLFPREDVFGPGDFFSE